METRTSTENQSWRNLNFKKFLEMAHIISRKNGKPNPIFIDGNYIEMMDMKFEKYPDPELKKKLLSIGCKFYAKLPHEPFFLTYDGMDLEVKSTISKDYLELPSDWADYAEFHYVDGSMKLPTKG